MDNHICNYVWNYEREEWIKIPAAIETVRLLGVGLARAGSCRCFFINITPSAANALAEITDAVAGGGVVKWDHFISTKDSMPILFVPPMQFNTGLFLETATNLTSVVFGVMSD